MGESAEKRRGAQWLAGYRVMLSVTKRTLKLSCMLIDGICLPEETEVLHEVQT